LSDSSVAMPCLSAPCSNIESIPTANKIELEVKWSEKAGAKRVITDEDAELEVGGESVSLPYHVCLSELLRAPEFSLRSALACKAPGRPDP
jgi:hypothetical protein